MAFTVTNIDLDYLKRNLAFETISDLEAFLTEYKCVESKDDIGRTDQRRLDCKRSYHAL